MHTRAAVSTNSLPLGVSVEVDAIFELNWFIYQHHNNQYLIFSYSKLNTYYAYHIF
jgi:hypothetical protein